MPKNGPFGTKNQRYVHVEAEFGPETPLKRFFDPDLPPKLEEFLTFGGNFLIFCPKIDFL